MGGQEDGTSHRRLTGRLFLALLVLSGAVGSASDEAAAPATVSADWVSQVRRHLADSEYHISWQNETSLGDLPAAWHAPNRAQGFRIYFADRGIRVVSRLDRQPTWEWGLTLAGFGRKTVIVPAAAVLVPHENRIEYRRGDLTEWYVNTTAGLKQGFTIDSRPEGAEAHALQLHLELLGGLNPRFSRDGQAIDFLMPGGSAVVHYAALAVEDATGRPLPARMDGLHQGERRMVRIVIDDSDAVYPITVDPLASNPSWTTESNQQSALLGFAVATAGDVNGDGFSDVIVGASGFDNGQIDEGRLFAYHGSPVGLDVSPDWIAESNQAWAHFSRSLHTAGDVNGDGYCDIVVGAPYWVNTTPAEGGAFLYLGSSSGLDNLGARPSGTPSNADWSAEGNQLDAYLGNSVAPAGDVNGDGFGDVIVGAFGYGNGHVKEGKIFVYYGNPSGLPAGPNWTAESNYANAEMGKSVSTAGDVNGDGYADIVVGAWRYENPAAAEGAAFVYHGSKFGLEQDGARPVGSPANADWSAEGNRPLSNFGNAVAAAGDVNGDGYSDIVIGAQYYDNAELDEGAAFVFHGSKFGLDPDGSRPVGSPANADWSGEGNQVSARYGNAVSTAGDVDGDGYAEVMVGAIVYDEEYNDAGRVYVYRGSPAGLAGSAFWFKDGGQQSAYFGSSVGTAGDVNSDGYADLLVGAYGEDQGELDEGRAYVYHGSAAGVSDSGFWMDEGGIGAAVSAGDINGDGYADLIALGSPVGTPPGFSVYQGSPQGLPDSPDHSDSGYFDCVSNAGDVNGDGYTDVIVGDGDFDGGNVDEGRVWVYYGAPAGILIDPEWLEVNVTDANFGAACSTAGDLNGDGYADVVVGAPGYRRDLPGQGCALLYHGSSEGLSASHDGYHRCGSASGAHFGAAVSTAGDVNGDGYSDVIVGAPDQWGGWAYVYPGSATGTSNDPIWNDGGGDAGTCSGGNYGHSVSTAGDVNGDGYADIVVGAPNCDESGFESGTAYVLYGSPTGPESDGWSQSGSTQGDHFGDAVSTAGDVNGDGFADVVVGAPRGGGQNPGRAYVYIGSAAGLTTSPLVLERQQLQDSFGDAVGGADVNGDGYSDVFIGASGRVGGPIGTVIVYYGGGGLGVDLRPRQRSYDDVSPLAPLGASEREDGFGLRLHGHTPFGRALVRLEWEVKPLGTAFDGQPDDVGTWTDTGSAGVELQQAVAGLSPGQVYHWRVRLRYHPGQVPFANASRWLTVPWNGSQEADFRTPGCSDNDDDGYGSPPSAWCSGPTADCDDLSGSVYPGAPQLCDGINNDCSDPSWPVLPTTEADGDNDGAMACSGDCDDWNSVVWGEPSVIRNLVFDANDRTLLWDVPLDPGAEANSIYYDTLRSGNSFDFLYSAECVERNDGPNRTADVPEAPLPGELFYYLVRADNACSGPGTLGYTSVGEPRDGRPCDPGP